ncbi:MAG: N-formylglutamate amidohydrolase, partial [Desulfatitalea sp.]|nr:N-formylglutamate amidohydrolase [Desulfatitalea sp.]
MTCEHGGNVIPRPYHHLFKGHGDLLAGHRGYDLGALGYARKLAARLDAPLFSATTSRLLADLNRTPGHPRLFSEMTRSLDGATKKTILEKYHRPHWQRVQAAIQESLKAGEWVVHIACHSFTPLLEGRERTMDVGLLYDPRREAERRFCGRWKEALSDRAPELRVRRNAPYKGMSDGLATHLRTLLPDNYLGIELELNQRDFIE